MTDEERAELVNVFGLLWPYAWIYAGSQDHRRLLLEIKGRIDAVLTSPPEVPLVPPT